MSSDGEGRQPDRRYRNDLQGVLQFASDVQNTERELTGDVVTHGVEQMSEETLLTVILHQRRQFLNSALNMMTVNIVDELKESVCLLQAEESDDETRIRALEQLHELCEDINAACDFQKMGGFPVLEKHLRHSAPEIRWKSAELLAAVVQNNPLCQKAATNVRIMRLLMDLLDLDCESMVRVKALYALSCLCRDCEEAQDEFCRLDGFSHLMRAMQCDNERLQIKSAFMLSSLVTSQPKFKDTLCDMGMVQQLIGLLQSPHSHLHEHILSALVVIVRGHPRAVTACLQPELEFCQFLKERIKEIDGKEEYEEEKAYAEQLMMLCFARPSSSGLER